MYIHTGNRRQVSKRGPAESGTVKGQTENAKNRQRGLVVRSKALQLAVKGTVIVIIGGSALVWPPPESASGQSGHGGGLRASGLKVAPVAVM